jgi:hypothetical protein
MTDQVFRTMHADIKPQKERIFMRQMNVHTSGEQWLYERQQR